MKLLGGLLGGGMSRGGSGEMVGALLQEALGGATSTRGVRVGVALELDGARCNEIHRQLDEPEFFR